MTQALDSVLTRAADEGGIADADRDRFRRHLSELPLAAAARINPLVFAGDAEIPSGAAIDLFVRGARLGAFDLEWGLVCPGCGAITQSVAALDQVAEDTTFCAFCQIDVESALDDTVEVSFAYAPPGAAIDLHDDFDAYRRYFISGSHPVRDQLTAYQRTHTTSDIKIAPGAAADWTLPIEPGESYRIFCHDIHATLNVNDGEEAPRPDEVSLSERGFNVPRLALPTGPQTLRFANHGEVAIWLRLVRVRMDEIMPIVRSNSGQYGPRLTGKHLINNQAFRDCFSMDSLAPDLKLKLRSLTLLFTDLKGSTALYDREGDLAAYRLVQDHFVALKGVVRGHSGAVIKTMGDAVMAAFPSGQDGVRAAIEMMQAMQAVVGQDHGRDVGLKVGLHSGPALAINAGNSIDYFGQTVNIAARVQGLAQAGDICVTRALEDDPDVSGLFAQSGYGGQRESARLKGVSAAEDILRYRRPD